MTVSRRTVLTSAALASVALCADVNASEAPPEDYKVVNNRIHQSAMA